MIRITALLAATGFTLSACAVLPDREGPGEVHSPEIDVSQVVEDEASVDCPAEQYQVIVGQPFAEVHVSSLPRPHRVYGESDMVTMDYRPDRMNIVVGDNGRVIEVKCG